MPQTIPLFKVYMSPTVKDEVAKVLESGYIGQGPKVDEFEAKLKERFKTDYVLTTNSATSAEHGTVVEPTFPRLAPPEKTIAAMPFRALATSVGALYPPLTNGTTLFPAEL